MLSKCCTFCDCGTIVSQLWKWLYGAGNISSLAYIILMHFRHLCLLLKGLCVCECERVMEAGGCWNKEERPRMNPEIPSDNWLVSLTHITWLKAASRLIPVLRHCSGIMRRSPSLWGAGNVGCPAWSIGCGRQSRGTRPRWMSGQHLFHLLVGSYQQKCCHTHWTGEVRRQRKWHSLQSLRKHACFCLSCKRKLGSLSGHAFAFHKAHKAHRVHLVVCDRICLYFW